MTVKTRETLMQRAMNGKPLMGQELRDLIDTMFWLKASPEQKTVQVVQQDAGRTSPAKPEFPEVRGTGFVKIGQDLKWYTDPSIYLTQQMGDSFYFRNALFPNDPTVYLAGDRTFRSFVQDARAAFTGGDGIDIVDGDVRVDGTVSRVGHQHSLTLSGDVSGSGLVDGTISTTVNAIRGGVVPPPGASGYFYWTGSSYSWVATPPPSTIALDDLADVILSSVTGGQVLWYDGSTGQWINKAMVANDLPTHASRHHSGGSDPLAGQSIAGLLTTSSPVFAALSLDGNLWLRNSGVRNWSIFGSNAFELASRNSDGSAIDWPIAIPHDAGGVIRLGGTTSRPVNLTYTLQMGGVTTINNAREGILTKLSIIKSLGATIGSASRVELLNNDSTYGQSFWSDSGGNLRLAFLQGDSTWTDRFTFMRTGALQIGGVETITSTRGGRFADLVVTGQTTLSTSLTGMLKAIAGVVSVAGSSDLPLHATRHHWDGADPITGQLLNGLRSHETPSFGGIKSGSVTGYLSILGNTGTEIARFNSSGFVSFGNITLSGDLSIANLTGILYAQNGLVRVALGTDLPSHNHVASNISDSGAMGRLVLQMATATDLRTSILFGQTPIILNLSTGEISHSNADGSKHVPANGTINSGKVLVASSSPGLYTWENLGVAQIPSHASKHHSGGSDPLAGQSIAGLLPTSSPTFASLLVLPPTTNGDIGFLNSSGTLRTIQRWDTTNDRLAWVTRNDDGSLRSTPFYIPRSSSLAVTVDRAFTVTGQTTLSTSLTGMLKAIAGVVSVAGSSDLPLHASLHHWNGADPLAGQSIAGLLVTSTPKFAGITLESLSSDSAYLRFHDSSGVLKHQIRRYTNANGDGLAIMDAGSILRLTIPSLASIPMEIEKGLSILTGDLTLNTNFNGLLKAANGVVSVASLSDIAIPFGRIPFGGSSGGMTYSDNLRFDDPYPGMLWVGGGASITGPLYADDIRFGLNGAILSASAAVIQFGDGVTNPRVLFPVTSTGKAFQVDGLATFAHIDAYLLEGDVQPDRDEIPSGGTRTLPSANVVGKSARFCAGIGPGTYSVSVANSATEAIVYRSRTTGLRLSATTLDIVDSATEFVCHAIGRWTAIGY